ncbi:hypothetical protein UIS43_22240 [Nocardiopsis sp. LDBS0036]|uniref:hypothetical protein n=1 Tax=Nocardiopsis sp. LDBS0036 TaxID=3104276 RepID=UPI003511AFAC
MTAEEEDRRARAELVRDVAGFPPVIAVLDSPDWEPAQTWFHEDPWTAGTRYVPVDPSPEPDGFGPTPRSHPLEGTDDPAWTPVYEGCDLEGGSRSCEEHGDVVIAVSADDAVGSLQARMVIAEGVGATLSTDPPTDETGVPTTEFPASAWWNCPDTSDRPGRERPRRTPRRSRNDISRTPETRGPVPLFAPYRAARVTATGHPRTGVWGTVRNGGRMVQETRTSVTKCCCRAFLG